ncbi:MAG: ACP S-malonyltransferase [Desulfovibrio sp.]|jgi:[acyl-carrier-protein] S-malonyltransferase|nr:ACP S-malonyltransferase [Desulfovibrio sp.]
MQEFSILFPGQGSQTPGMGRDVADASSEAMELWKQAEEMSGLPLRGIFWEGSKEEMEDTRALQPGLTVVNLTLWQALSRKVKPLAVAGHSLGEFSALAAAGVLTPEETLQAVSLRGRLMAESDPDGRGAMAAVVKLPLEKVESIVEKARQESGQTVLVANYNNPGQYVVSGEKEAVALVGSLAKEAKGRAIPLAVSGAFHSPLMEKANAEFSKLLKKLTFRKPRVPFYSNAAGGPLAEGESIRGAMLNQMTSPVRWDELMRSQAEAGIRSWIEVGPKAVLGKMVSRCLEPMGIESGSISVGLVSDLGSLEKING